MNKKIILFVLCAVLSVFAVTFDTVGRTEIQPQVLDEGSLANRLENDPEKNGYAFNGWSFNFDKSITENVTVKASWQRVFSVSGNTITGLNPYCKRIEKIVIPNSIDGVEITKISAYAFEGVRKITSVVIQEGITTIGDVAFYGCTSLTSIEIPSSVTSIGEAAFYGCEKLESVIFSENATWIVDDQLGSVVEIDLSNASLNVIYLTEEFYNCQWYKK